MVRTGGHAWPHRPGPAAAEQPETAVCRGRGPVLPDAPTAPNGGLGGFLTSSPGEGWVRSRRVRRCTGCCCATAWSIGRNAVSASVPQMTARAPRYRAARSSAPWGSGGVRNEGAAASGELALVGGRLWVGIHQVLADRPLTVRANQRVSTSWSTGTGSPPSRPGCGRKTSPT